MHTNAALVPLHLLSTHAATRAPVWSPVEDEGGGVHGVELCVGMCGDVCVCVGMCVYVWGCMCMCGDVCIGEGWVWWIKKEYA